MELAPGAVVGDKVRLERQLGQGGMGSVWVGEHLALHTKVAVKFISSEIASLEQARTRFTREATAAARIRSPHVVQIFDHGVSESGTPYMVMELLEGEDLGKRIERQHSLPLSDVTQIVAQACKALTRAHALGIVHRDIKPDNLFLIDSDGDIFVKVLDFGIAKHTQDTSMNMTSTGSLMGTPYYMSPEQVMGSKSLDLRSDLWSLAVVAYNALTGELPFAAETLGALCVSINAGKFEPPSRRAPHLGATIDAWFEKALAHDAEARFGSAKEMADALQVASTGQPVTDARASFTSSPSLGSSVADGRMQVAVVTNPAVASGTSPSVGTLMEATVSPRPEKRSPSWMLFAAGGLGLLTLGIGLAFALSGGADGETEAIEQPASAASGADSPQARKPEIAAPTADPAPLPSAAADESANAPEAAASASAAAVEKASAAPAGAAGPVATAVKKPAARVAPAPRRAKKAAPKPEPAKPASKPRKDYGF